MNVFRVYGAIAGCEGVHGEGVHGEGVHGEGVHGEYALRPHVRAMRTGCVRSRRLDTHREYTPTTQFFAAMSANMASLRTVCTNACDVRTTVHANKRPAITRTILRA